MALMLLSLQGSIIGPCYAYILHETKTIITNFQIPFIEEHSNAEFDLKFSHNLMLASVIGIHKVAMTIFDDVVRDVKEPLGAFVREVGVCPSESAGRTDTHKIGSLTPLDVVTKIEWMLKLKNTDFSVYNFMHVIKQALNSNEYE